MKVRKLLELQANIEERKIPCDLCDDELNQHYSQSKDVKINILDLHLTHAIRILNNYLEDNIYPKYSDRQEINDSLRGIKDRVEDISEVVNK